MIIVMFGAPGVGKGTIANRLVKKHNMKILSASEILKREVAKKTKIGKTIQEYMLNGKLVPTEIIIPLIAKAIKNVKSKNIILDGFPRNIEQANEIIKVKKIDLVLDLKASEKIILERLTGRRICPKCKTIYHTKNLKPKIKGICDNDGEKLIQRPDDKLSIIKKRLKVYNTETKPLEKYFNKLKLIKKINSSDNPENILKRIEKIL